MANLPFTTKRGGLFVQPNGPNTPTHFLGCHTLGDITESEGALELLRCFNPEGTGWETKGSVISPPDPVGFSVEARMHKTRSWIRRIEFPASFYVLQSEVGRRDLFHNYNAGMVLAECRRTTKTRTGVVHMEEDGAAMASTEWEAWPPVYEIDELEGGRKATAIAVAVNDIWMNTDAHDFASWGTRLYRGQRGMLVGANLVPQLITDYGDTIANTAAIVPTNSITLASVQGFYIDQNTVRYLVADTAPAGAGQGEVSYSDDDGATWTDVAVGGAVAMHGAMGGQGLHAPNQAFALLGTKAGFIYKSIDGGQTWDVVDAAGISVANYNCIHADPTDTYCIAGGPADKITLSDDAGENWIISPGVTGGGGDILSCWRFDENNMWVSTDDGELWYTVDGGENWVEQTRSPLSGTGSVVAMSWVNRHVGFIAHNTAGPVGTVWRTINGGYDWEAVDTPANSGLSAVQAVDVNMCYVAGLVNAATGFVMQARSDGVILP